MVSCNLMGRLGNQLFQIATTYAFAKDNGFECVIPKQSLSERLWPSMRFKGLNYSNVRNTTYEEPHFHYSPIPKVDNITLHGYWQSWQYFDGHVNDLYKIFGFDTSVQRGTVAIHVRRGDYVTFKDQFNLLPVSWYMNAINEISNNGELDYEYHFFSDDIAWCKKHFCGSRAVFHTGIPIEDMREGAKCEHHIISASSFGWWMAYMGLHDNQKVIAPNTWFGPHNQHHNTNDLYLPTWKRL